MEEEIREILDNELDLIPGHRGIRGTSIIGMDNVALVIANHFREFIKWLISDDMIWTDCTDPFGHRTVIEIDDKEYTLNEIYQYWIDNIKEK